MSTTSVPQRIFAFTMAAVFLISACAFSAFVIYDMHNSKQKEKDTQAATQKQAANSSQGKKLEGFEPVSSVTELKSTDTKPGEGTEAKAGDNVTVDYTGAVAATGEIFQSSKDSGQPATLALDQVIEGWKEGIPGMKEGGVRRLLIPAEKAYGANPPQGSSIPANAALVFDVTLIKVNPPSPQGEPSAKPAQ
jgi:FKBP-type peptidyl-prolyl cis-trans isomerase